MRNKMQSMIPEIADWLEKRCVRDAQALSETAELFNDWWKWAVKTQRYAGKRKGFTIALMNSGFKIGRGSHGERSIIGVALAKPGVQEP